MAGDERVTVVPLVQLSYMIDDVSSYSGEFSPRHILEDKPSDQKSRWLSDGNKPPQYVTLKLEKAAIVRKILFGKYERSHPCNIQKLRVYGGMNSEHMNLIFEGGLNNDGVPEMMDLVCSVDGHPFPCQYIKIVPLQSWGGSFNLSIWHVQLWGISEETQVEDALSHLMKYREREALRLCLKHLRQYDYSEAFEALQKKSKILLEHPLLTKLHCALVTRGDFEEAENIVCNAMEEGFFDSYVSRQPVKAQWTLIPYLKDDDDKNSQSVPTTTLDMRGGHQMCIDSDAGMMYLYGGWDGSKELGDLWQFNIINYKWTCLSLNTLQEDGPGTRSCHAMCFDPQQNGLYVLGGYFRSESISELLDCPPSQFYFYSIDKRKWHLLSSDTFKDEGPKLMYNHQMCYDSFSGLLYVLGGRIVSTDICSGLYAYHTVKHHWLCLSPDQSSASIQQPHLPRSGHVMLLHPTLHKLFVLGGQRQQEILGDMLTYDVRSGETSILTNGKDQLIPVAGFTLCASMDITKHVICVLTGLSKLEDREAKGSNSLWFYNIPLDQWSKVVKDDNMPLHNFPVPRYAHSFVYDSVHGVSYMFGGNPGSDAHTKSGSTMRLDDFWKLELLSQSKEKLLRDCQLMLRKQRYIELSSINAVEAVAYLQLSVAALVDHSDEDESRQYRELTGILFSSEVDCPLKNATTFISPQKPQRMRSELYDKLAVCFPDNMSQPKDNLTDFIKLN